jgi:hypothetical protein
MTGKSIFLPSKDRALRFDKLMRERLAGSLAYLHEVTEGRLLAPSASLVDKIEALRTKPVLPEVFATYYELVPLLEDGDLDQAAGLFQELLNFIGDDVTFEIVPFRAGQDVVSTRYKKQVTSDTSTEFEILPASEGDFLKAKALILEALDLIGKSCPELHDEIGALLKRIMVGTGPTGDGVFTFDGASAFGLWGAIMLNALTQLDVVDMAQTLAHESCHNLLFGYCIDGRLVENPDDELHASPLRADPRPLDGIFHATFVLARMHFCVSRIAELPGLDRIIQKKASEEAGRRAAGFYDGLATLKAHARYTAEGRELMDAAEAYMNHATDH